MLTPQFNIQQSENFLTIEITAPYTKVSDTEIFFEGCEFRFYSKPYFLRLNLPGQVVENGEETASYDVDKGSFLITVPKVNPGEHFDGLDLQTKLLATKRKSKCGPLIEVLSSTEPTANNDSDEDDFSWDVYQNPYTDEPIKVCGREYKYGFGNEKSGVFNRLQDEIPDLIDVKDPDEKTLEERRGERLSREMQDFNDDHYLADLYQDEEIGAFIAYKPAWITDGEKLGEEDSISFTEEEKEHMRKLPRKDYLLSRDTKQESLLGLVDILFSYAYSIRTTEGDANVESAWTITKLSATLSWLETHPCLKSTILSSLRRSLCYPLYRHWGLAQLVLKDTITIMTLGTKWVLKCLLDLHRVFSKSEPYYILNDLYITDYCVWVQNIKTKTFLKLADALQTLKIAKNDVDLELVELEQAAELALGEENEGEDVATSSLTSQLNALHLPNEDSKNRSDAISSCSDGSDETDSDDCLNSSSDDDSDNTSSSSSSSSESDTEYDNCLQLKKDASNEKFR